MAVQEEGIAGDERAGSDGTRRTRMKAIGSARMASYAVKLRLSLLGMAVPAVVLAALGGFVLVESQYRLEHGRIASDIYATLLEFDLEKSELRNWS